LLKIEPKAWLSAAQRHFLQGRFLLFEQKLIVDARMVSA